MKTMCLMLSTFLLLGCTKPAPTTPPDANGPVTGDEVTREIDEATDAAAQYLDQQQEAFRRDFEERLAKLDVDIERLKQKAADAKADAKPRWEAARRELEEKRAQAQAKLDELKAQAPGAWDEFKQGAEEAWTDLKSGYNKAVQELEAESPESENP